MTPPSQTPRTSLLECSAVGRQFEVAGKPFDALMDVSVRFEAGEFVAITGPSGSGKSTFLNVVGSLDRPSSGVVALNGTDLTNLADTTLAQVRNRSIGFVFQSFNLLPRYSLLRNVELPLVYAGVDASVRRERAIRLLKRLGISDGLERRPAQISGGQQQRVAIARALVNDPPLILADEPTGSLDSTNGSIVIELLAELCREQGKTVLMVTHDNDIATHCPRQLIFRDGRLLEDRRR
jgi:putative ABC transport system ATP-binding protein